MRGAGTSVWDSNPGSLLRIVRLSGRIRPTSRWICLHGRTRTCCLRTVGVSPVSRNPACTTKLRIVRYAPDSNQVWTEPPALYQLSYMHNITRLIYVYFCKEILF